MAVLGAVGWALGVVEMVMTAAAGLALVAGGVAYVRLAAVGVEADRTLRPPRRHAGAAGDVEVTVRNTKGRPSPTLVVEDPFHSGLRRARFQVTPLPPGQALTAAYELPGQERGRYHLGPLEVRLEDPFGLASRVVTTAPSTSLVVYPRIDPLDTRWPDPDWGGRSGPRPVAQPADGDLYALREYHMGDDLRRVHWRSTAKQDEVMIRHDDAPLRHATTVVLDLREEVHTSATLEEAVSAAASVVHAAWRRGRPVRLVTTDGSDSAAAGGGPADADALLERLACARTHPVGAPMALDLALADGDGWRASILVVITTGAAYDGELDRLRGPSAVVVVEHPDRPGDRRLPTHPRIRLVRVGPGRPLSSAWAGAMAAGRSRTAVRP